MPERLGVCVHAVRTAVIAACLLVAVMAVCFVGEAQGIEPGGQADVVVRALEGPGLARVAAEDEADTADGGAERSVGDSAGDVADVVVRAPGVYGSADGEAGERKESGVEARLSTGGVEVDEPGSGEGSGDGAGLSAGDEAQTGQACRFQEIPDWVVWREREMPADLDGDGVCESRVTVGTGHGVSVTVGDVEVFSSPQGWLVSDAFAYDLDGDGAQELVLMVWKRGSYGAYQPFWEQGEDEAWSQHVYVYGMREGRVTPVWMSSALGMPVREASLDSAGVLELTAPDGACSRWRWGTWGFELLETEAADAAGKDFAGGSDEGMPADQATDEGLAGISARGAAACGGAARGAAARVSLVFAGDNIVYPVMYEGAYDNATREFDFSGLYANVRDFISGFDVALVCQETVLVRDAAKRSGYPEFATPASVADALAGAGFDVVAAASNHVADKGADAVRETLAYWAERHPEVAVAGLHDLPDKAVEPAVVCAGELDVAVFNLTYGLNGHDLAEGEEYLVDTLEDKDAVFDGVRAPRDAGDFVVVVLHTGREYSNEPTAEQREVVEEAIDAGADLVVCSHAHVVAPYGEVRTATGNVGLVYWGLGNFAAAQGEIACQVGGLATVEVELARGCAGGEPRARIASYGLVPYVCHVGKDGSAAVYLLDDYTDELAAQHVLSSAEKPLRAADFRQAFEEGVTQGPAE